MVKYDGGSQGWKGGVDTSFLPLAFVFGLKGMDRSGFNWFFPYLNRGEVSLGEQGSLLSTLLWRGDVQMCHSSACYVHLARNLLLILNNATVI